MMSFKQRMKYPWAVNHYIGRGNDRRGAGGFALVIALSLMAFVLMLLLSITTLVRVESQSASIALAREKARQNARFGAMVALGELQKAAGPDQRVTAQADLSGGAAPGQKLWTGVWDSANGQNIEWLVSGDNPEPADAAADPALLVDLPGEGDGDNAQDVRAPKVDFGGSSADGRYAYWVGDEGVKASLRALREENRDGDGAPATQNLALGMQGFEFPLGSGSEESAWELPFGGADHRDPESAVFALIGRILGLNEAAFLPDVPPDIESRLFHDMTPASFGVLAGTHPDFPGLKHDLSLQPDTSGLGGMALGEGYEAYADYAASMLDPKVLEERVVGIETADDLRRVYKLRGPTPSVEDLIGGNVYPQESPRKGTPVFGIYPVLTQFHLNLWPHVSANIGSASDRDLLMLVAPLARFWNPYTSALDMRDAKLRLEISGFPEMDLEFRDFATGQVTDTSFDPGQVYSDPLVFEYELDNNNRAARGNRPDLYFLTPDTAYDELVWGPGRVMPFSKHSFDESRDVWRHSANHTLWSFNESGKFEGAERRIEKMPGKAPPMTNDVPVPPIRVSYNKKAQPRQIQKDIFDYLQIVFDVPSFQLTVDVFVVDEDENKTRVQSLAVNFPRADPFPRKVREVLPTGSQVGANYGIPGGRFYVAGPSETAISYSFRLREAAPGVAEFDPSSQWLENDPRWASANSPASATGLTSSDQYAPTYDRMDIYAPNFDAMFSWRLNDVNGREDRIYSSLINRMYGRVKSSAVLSNNFPYFANTARDVYLFELPRRPQLSLGALQHLQVYGYPPYAIGNSWGRDPEVASPSELSGDMNLIFDRYFLSGIAPGRSEPGFGEGRDRPLPHPNTVFRNPAPEIFPEDGGAARDQLLLDAGADSGAFLMTDGAFNINSTSATAWEAVLGSQRLTDFRRIEADSNLWDSDYADGVQAVETTSAYFTRFPQTLQEIDPDVLPEGDVRTQRIEDYKRSLTEVAADSGNGVTFDVRPLRDLAREVVERIKNRDRPFLTLSEFLGPLDPAQPEDGSLLEQAIAAAGINDPAAHPRSPGFLTQADLLNFLAPILQPRSDTFRIRAYGASGGGPGTAANENEAWCEMVVQRVVEPVEPLPVDAGAALAALRDGGGRFGRRFRIVSFNWLEGPGP